MLRFLVLAALCLEGVLLEQSRVLEQRKPFFERFRRLEEQFRRFQEVTLTRLQGIAENYNISYNIDARFQHVVDQQQSLTQALNVSSEMTQRELSGVKIWLKKIQRKTKKLDLKMSSLEEALTERNKQVSRDNKARDATMANLTSLINSQKRVIDQLAKENNVMKKGMEMFREVVKRQGGKIATLEEQVRGVLQNEVMVPSSLMAAQELNRTPDNKQLGSPGNDPGPMSSEHRLSKLEIKHIQRKRLQDQQQLLIPGKVNMSQMITRHGNEAKNVRPTEEIQTAKTPPHVTKENPSDFHSTKPPSHATMEKPSAIHSTRPPPPPHQPIEKPSDIGDTKPASNGTHGKPPGLETTKPPPSVTEISRTTEQTTRVPGTICNIDSMLIFPNSSTENYATFGKGLRESLHEFSICSWVKTQANYVGTILSYATEDNDNKLVLHGRNGEGYDSLHFVIGDPTFRELPMVPLTDGRWHHTCFIWSSIQGKYWFYVDRRLASTGSRFQKGYEIPPGGSLVLGQEQDTMGGGFDSSEAFVGRLAGFAMWKRALSPGEVSGIATGRGFPRGTILTLSDASSLHGSVQRVPCTCLEHCL
ncbi:pentraxin-4 [Pelodytes ibericus]